LQQSIAKLTKAQVTDVFSYSRHISASLFSTKITEKKKGILVTFPNQEKYPLPPFILFTISKLVFKRPKSKFRSVPKEKKKRNVRYVPKSKKSLFHFTYYFKMVSKKLKFKSRNVPKEKKERNY
jgi:hypothetical protein